MRQGGSSWAGAEQFHAAPAFFDHPRDGAKTGLTPGLAGKGITENQGLEMSPYRPAGLFLSTIGGAMISHARRDGTVIDDAGMTSRPSRAYRRNGKRQGISRVRRGRLEHLEAEADILIPAAMELVITETNAARIKTPLIIEAANGPTPAEADEILRERSRSSRISMRTPAA